MPLLLQICLVIVTTAVVAIAIAMIRAIMRLEKAAHEVSETAQAIANAMSDVKVISREVHEVVTSVSDIVPHVKRVATQFEAVGGRAADISSVVLDEVEAPVRKAVAVVRGVRSGAAYLLQSMMGRRKQTTTNGRVENERVSISVSSQ
jgi:uncharacterized protein YoxC